MALQKSSIEKLSTIYNVLTEMEGGKRMAEMIQEVIRAESATAKVGKFNIFDYTDKDHDAQAYIVYKSIYHHEGQQIATDGRILMVTKSDYPSEIEGKLLLKNGETVEGKFPNWEKVVPMYPLNNGYREITLKTEGFLPWLSQIRAEYKAKYVKGRTWSDYWYVRVDGTYLRAEYFSKLMAAASHLGTDKILVKENDTSRPVIVQNENGSCLLMPCYKPDDDENLRVLDI